MQKLQVTSIEIGPEAPFSFQDTVYSHGWVSLAPNNWEKENDLFRRVEQLNFGQVVQLVVSGNGLTGQPQIKIEVHHHQPLSAQDTSEIKTKISHMMRIDEDFSTFYDLCRKKGGRWLKVTEGMGRLLRSPQIFEDIVKTICTTNIQWGGTKRMVEGLVGSFGQPFDGDNNLKTFPTVQRLAETDREAFCAQVRMGYRAPYVHELAQLIADGKINPDAFWDTQMPTDALHKKLLAIKGIGNYAAATLLMLLGRYDKLPVDSVFRDFVGKKYFPGKAVSDKELQTVYREWDQWKYLAYWFDIWQGTNENV